MCVCVCERERERERVLLDILDNSKAWEVDIICIKWHVNKCTIVSHYFLSCKDIIIVTTNIIIIDN